MDICHMVQEGEPLSFHQFGTGCTACSAPVQVVTDGPGPVFQWLKVQFGVCMDVRQKTYMFEMNKNPLIIVIMIFNTLDGSLNLRYPLGYLLPDVKEMLGRWSLLFHVFLDTWVAICDEDLSVKTNSIQASHAPR